MFTNRSKSAAAPSDDTKRGFIARMRARLNQGDSWLTYDLANLLPGRTIDAEVLEELETRLLTGDVGVDATERILGSLRDRVQRKELKNFEALAAALRTSLLEILEPSARPLRIDTAARPFVILVVGVNGSGKTTTIGKLARRLTEQNLKVMLAAGDTFRAAAIEQLEVWGRRNNVPVIAQQSGADPAAVIFDALQVSKIGTAPLQDRQVTAFGPFELQPRESVGHVGRTLAGQRPKQLNEHCGLNKITA